MQKNRQFGRVNADELVGLGDPSRSKVYNASGHTEPTFHFSNHSKTPTLYTEGFALDTVHAKQQPALMKNIPSGWTDFLGWTNTDTNPPDKLWRLLAADRGPDCNPLPHFYHLAYAKSFQQIEPGHGLDIAKELTTAGVAMKQFLKRVQSVVWGRRLMRTNSHRLVGLVPAETNKRELIVILSGCSVPVVSRRVEAPESNEETFKLIGECFIYGMMDGEAMDFKLSRGIETQTFAIL
ncbi:hypothetical protein OEA41_010658 [Lepraria neglecta]|uniref:Uncharacterized protein n=1 Tax=Lepraria neglecta TaxID=209136 RepID=A0AAE0DFC2_9LECA|nr:hypothetical protein OEA41_010658 [Lepraria neglecta]